jgi:Flp pilus assembly protein TadD
VSGAPASARPLGRSTIGLAGKAFTPSTAADSPNPISAHKMEIHFPPQFRQATSVRCLLPLLLSLVLATLTAQAQTNRSPVASSLSQIIEASGTVEFATSGSTAWQAAAKGRTLQAGDKIRTRAQSRAAVQLSDRSIVRLDEQTTLEILPPRNSEKKRFGLSRGALYFFNREKPADVEFDTPLAAGAIRGTEFLLAVAETNSSVHLALIDGLVSLKTTANEEINLQRGEELQLAAGQAPIKTALVNATAKIQWALYYPAIINPADLTFTANETSDLAAVLANYRTGDLLAALAIWPAASTNDSAKILHAQLELAVGRVNEAEALLATVTTHPAADALRELISVVRVEKIPPETATQNASLLLAHSYAQQARADLAVARVSARQAVSAAPDFGFAHARLAELEFAFGNRRSALAELDRARELSPRLAAASALQGFVELEQGHTAAALTAFDHARELDAALGSAWLGRGLCLLHQRNFVEARAAFQAAAALEPQRSTFRSYLGKAANELVDTKAAEKEFRLAKELDPNDPTPWLYSALHLWQENRLNEAIRDLETSSDKNDNRAAFRSRELLDSDRSVRSANLTAIYHDAGLTEVSDHVAARAVSENYGNFSGHLFLANSYQSQEDANRFDLRLESARQSELLVANLLAPPGAGNLSQALSQQDRLRFFEQKPFGFSSLTTYGSGGDWSETATAFGSTGGFSYAFDTVYQSLNGDRVNNKSEQRQFALTMKQRITADDELYFQIGDLHANAGDVANLYEPTNAHAGFTVHERQEPNLYAGWHHAWSPNSHTLFLASRLIDDFSSHDANKDVLFLQTDLFGQNIIGVQQGPLAPPPTGQGPVISDLSSKFTLYSAELQHVWENADYSLIIGGRGQVGDLETKATLSNIFVDASQPIAQQATNNTMQRVDAYAYGSWQLLDSLRVIGGASYAAMQYPRNTDLPPIEGTETSRQMFSPKVGLLFEPWKRGLFRASYTKSLGGLYFDNSLRLEPTQVGGFNQTFRSLLPESVAGLVPGSEFETISLGFDQTLPSGTFFGIETEQLSSQGQRDVGAFKNAFGVLSSGSVSSTPQTLDFRERNLSAYVAQLLGDYFSASARYRLSEAKLIGQFPEIPDAATGLSQLEQNNRAVLHQIALALNFNHRSGLFAQWESSWYHQNNFGYSPALPTEDFCQHNLMVGYRFAHRHAELRTGILNLADTDYRMNPLNFGAALPRGRTFIVSLRLNF